MSDVDDTKKRIEHLSAPGSYKNSRQVSVGGIPYTMKDILMIAPLIAGLNVYLIGGTGEGKTQLANDLASSFGDSYCYAEGRPDFEPSELLKQLRLDKLHDVKSDKELVELTENVKKMLYYVDELNRCPPIVMNYFFNFFDGKLVHNGKVLRLGRDNYAIGYASGNLGDGAYVGISDVDRALKDRMHLIVKIDDPDFCTTEEDDLNIFLSKKDPRASAPQAERASIEDIIVLNERFKQREVPVMLPILGMFFHKGLDYLEDTARHSKRAIDQQWPNVNELRDDSDEKRIFPISKRAVFATMALAQALEMIAESRGQRVNDGAEVFLDALKFTVPYSGVLSPQLVTNSNGDAYAAFNTVMTGIKAEIQRMKPDVEYALAFASFGKRDPDALEKLRHGRWNPVRKAIEHLAERTPESEKHKLSDILEEAKKLPEEKAGKKR